MAWRSCELQGKKIGDGGDHAREWEPVASCYLKIWTTYGKDACEAKQPGCERMDAVLFNAAKAFQAARLLAKAIAVRKLLLDPRYGLDHTEVAKKSVRDIGGNYQSIAVYDESAAWYERFAHDSPTVAKAPDALEDAIVMRLGLGQADQALRDADLFQHAYRAQHPALAAQIAFAIGAHDVEHDDLAQARKRLTAAMGEIDRSATLEVQFQAHALLGRVLWKTGSDTGAAAEYAKVRSLYRDPAAVTAKLASAGGDEATRSHRLGKVLTAVGEAIFFTGSQKQKAVEVFKFPEYKGSGRRDEVLAHINGKVAAWMNKKRPAILEAEKEYHQVVDLTPLPPPRWVIASGARVGQMWGKFVAEFRAAPIPKEWKQNGPSPYGDLTWEEIRATYYAAIDAASEPDRKRAKAAYDACLTLLVALPVLRRALAGLRGVALQDLRDRVPHPRRAPRRALAPRPRHRGAPGEDRSLIEGPSLRRHAASAFLQPRARGLGNLWSDNPGKRASPAPLPRLRPSWGAVTDAVIASPASPAAGRTGRSYNRVGFGLWLVLLVAGFALRAEEDRGRPGYRLDHAKLSAYVAAFAFFSSYFGTCYFYEVLGTCTPQVPRHVEPERRAGLPLPADRRRTSPLYTTLFDAALQSDRASRGWPAGARHAWSPCWIHMAGMETALNGMASMKSSFCYGNLGFALWFGTLMYGSHFVLAGPCWHRIDERRGEDTRMGEVLASVLAAQMLIMCVDEVFSRAIAPRFTTVVAGRVGIPGKAGGVVPGAEGRALSG